MHHPAHSQHGNSSHAHNYHQLQDIDEEAEELWDQLNDEQSREVQQHQSRFRAADPRRSRTSHFVIAQSMVWTTVGRVGATASSAWYAAKEAWQHHRPRPVQNTDLDFDEQFGIHDLRPTSFSVLEDDDDAAAPDPTQRIRNARPNPGYPFVVLQQYPSRQSIQRARDHWGIVANMDIFLSHLYQYYRNRGLVPMVCHFLLEITSLLFTLWLSRILLQDVNWRKLATCNDEQSCLPNWSDYYYPEDSNQSIHHRWLVQGYTLLVLVYAGFLSWSFWQSLKHAWTCQYIMHEKLGISARKLQGGAVAWDTVVEKLVQVQDSGEYRMALSTLDPLRISQRIMRKDNFLIAFWNQNLMDVQVGNRQYWCPSLEWCVHTCILNFMFNHKYEIRPAFLLDAASLERRLQVCGVVHFLMLPFLMLFVILHFLFRNAYDFKTSKQYMGNKQWSTVAQWTFREFNELPHVLERRLEPSYQASENYLKLFGQSEWVAAVGKLLVFLGGAMAGVLFVLGILNDAILLHVQLWGRNLLWYAGIAGIVYSVGKALLPTKEAQPSVTRNLFADMDTALKNVSTHNHYYPEHWKGRGWDKKVHSQFGLLFDSKVKLFLWELVSLVLAPYILIAKLSKCAPEICEFCMTVKAKVSGAGDVCGYSTFDFDIYRDEAWEGKTLGKSILVDHGTKFSPQTDDSVTKSGMGESLVESIMRTGNLEKATRQHPKPRAREGKMEKSFFSFQAEHPEWKCSPSGQALVDQVEEYRQTELADAITREQELYIKAAARQLDTLAQLEGTTKQHHPSVSLVRSSNTSSINTSTTPSRDPRHIPSIPVNQYADADAGTHPSPQQVERGSPPSPPPIGTLQAIRPRPDQYVLSAPATLASSTGGLPFASGIESSTGASESARSSVPQDGGLTPTLPINLNHQPHHLQSGSNLTSRALPAPAPAASVTSATSSEAVLRAGLSTELRRLLTLSTLESGESVYQGSIHRPPSSTSLTSGAGSSSRLLQEAHERTPGERQYYWLERFHEHLECQQQTLTDSNSGDPLIARSVPSTSQTPAYQGNNDHNLSASNRV